MKEADPLMVLELADKISIVNYCGNDQENKEKADEKFSKAQSNGNYINKNYSN